MKSPEEIIVKLKKIKLEWESELESILRHVSNLEKSISGLDERISELEENKNRLDQGEG